MTEERLTYAQIAIKYNMAVAFAAAERDVAERDAEIARLRKQIEGHVERIAAASEVIAKNAERSPLARLEAWRKDGPERMYDASVINAEGYAVANLTQRLPEGRGVRLVQAFDRPISDKLDCIDSENYHLFYAGTDDKPATLAECILAALDQWERLHSKDGAA